MKTVWCAVVSMLLALVGSPSGAQEEPDRPLRGRLAEASVQGEPALAHLCLAESALSRGDTAAARRQYWIALDAITPPVEEWQQRLRRQVLHEVFIQKEWLDDALAAYRQYPDYTLLLALGRRLKEDGRGFEMLDLYCDYLVAEPDEQAGMAWGGSPGTPHGLADQVLSEIMYVGEGPAVVERLKAAVIERPRNPEPLRHAGYLLFKMGRLDEGLRELERYLAVKAKPLAVDYAGIASLCENAGLAEEAIRYYEQALSMEWTDDDRRAYAVGQRQSQIRTGVGFRTRTLWSLANLYVRQERWAEAEAHLKEILDSGEPWYQQQAKAKLTEIWDRTGKTSVFLDDLKRQVAADPCSAPLREAYAELSLNAGQTQAAVTQFEQAVELSPGDLSLRLQLARALVAARQTDRALAQYRAVLHAASRKDRDEFRRGKGGDETEPERVLFETARLCERLREVDALRDLYEGVLESLESPDVLWLPDEYTYERILRDMAEIYRREGEHDRAIELWLAYRKQVGRAARHAVADVLGYHSPLWAFVATGGEPRPSPPLPIGSSAPLRSYIETLREQTGADPNDSWGRFILGDMLAADRRPDEAMGVYVKLLYDAPPDGELYRDLGSLFADIGRDDLVLTAWENQLGTLEQGTGEYARKLGQMAALHLKAGNKAEAARLYRKAIAIAPAEADYRYGLFAATDGREGNARPARGPIESLRDKRIRVQTLLSRGDNPQEVVELCEQILRKAPTDVVCMACLARAYEQLGRKADAIAWFEKAHDMRRWSSTDPGAASDLRRLYSETGQEDKLVGLLRELNDYHAIRDFYKSRGRAEEFEQYLLERAKDESDTDVYWHLGAHYLDTGNQEAAARVYEGLRLRLVDEEDAVPNTLSALSLAQGFERLNRLEEALAIVASVDFEHDADASDWLGTLRTRLYLRTGRFEEGFDVCVLRLKKHPDEYRALAVAVARQLVYLLKDVHDARRLIDGFLADLKGQIPEHQYEYFRGAMVSHMNAEWPPAGETDQGPDLLALLKEGRKVAVPQNCRSLAEFLEKLAARADTAAIGSFLIMSGRAMDAPQVDVTTGSAFEILAVVLNGTTAAMEMTQEGYWLLSEGPDGRKVNYAASGGLLCVTDGFNRRIDRQAPWLLGRMFFEPAVRARLVSTQLDLQVIEAVDERGRTVPVVPIPSSKLRWSIVGQVEAFLPRQDPPATRIVRMRVKTAVACQATLPPRDRPGASLPSRAIPLETAINFSPARPPEGVEVVPFELTFHNLPIVERPSEDR